MIVGYWTVDVISTRSDKVDSVAKAYAEESFLAIWPDYQFVLKFGPNVIRGTWDRDGELIRFDNKYSTCALTFEEVTIENIKWEAKVLEKNRVLEEVANDNQPTVMRFSRPKI